MVLGKQNKWKRNHEQSIEFIFKFKRMKQKQIISRVNIVVLFLLPHSEKQ